MTDFLAQNLAWMYWTVPTALFFSGLFVTLIAMGIWDRQSPSLPRQGFLPMPTTRGDRLFLTIITAIGITLLWLVILGNTALPAMALLVVAAAAAIAWKG
jgi:predicted small integral membrane protein